ncbi:uncharacterized protein BJ171DRAFT_154832 [Polychytrium aggregatum]|uniref:uncharacterized protein n=1 Tax=Polychytrium aggregatum TaxID=110093 RepID=UPI0022FE16D5|nr:uncharacterized protein BJ171DRAFT_154832 [Polychytrium aggregatum]KAI9203208.1 hypothetical protein BJ171DRAFT_154832 [Polychytrium aggregatum]
MDLAAALGKRRVIVHLDLDAFYCQVEHVRLGIPLEVPLAVQQWTNLIAVNYTAKASGVKRHAFASDALAQCPDLKLVHVATFTEEDIEPTYHPRPTWNTHKVSLDVYRRASVKIMKLLHSLCPKFQKASIDEAYMDVTDMVYSEIKKTRFSDTDLASGPTVAWDGLGYIVGFDKNPGAPIVTHGWADYQLWVGAHIAQDFRKLLWDQLGYTSSCGIAHNKTLAKICSGLNKPNNQTIMREAAVVDFMRDHPLLKIPQLGGKLGSELQREFGFETAGDVWSTSKAALCSKLGESTGEWVFNISRGLCSSELTDTVVVKSLGTNKNFRPAITSVKEMKRWICILCIELYFRLTEEFEESHRWPKTMTIGVYPAKDSAATLKEFSKARPMPPRSIITSVEVLKAKALEILSDEQMQGSLPLKNLGLSMSGLTVETTQSGNIRDMFQRLAKEESSAGHNKPVAPIRSDKISGLDGGFDSVAKFPGDSCDSCDPDDAFASGNPYQPDDAEDPYDTEVPDDPQSSTSRTTDSSKERATAKVVEIEDELQLCPPTGQDSAVSSSRMSTSTSTSAPARDTVADRPQPMLLIQTDPGSDFDPIDAHVLPPDLYRVCQECGNRAVLIEDWQEHSDFHYALRVQGLRPDVTGLIPKGSRSVDCTKSPSPPPTLAPTSSSSSSSSSGSKRKRPAGGSHQGSGRGGGTHGSRKLTHYFGSK